MSLLLLRLLGLVPGLADPTSPATPSSSPSTGSGIPVKGPDSSGAETGTWLLVALVVLLVIGAGSIIVLILRDWLTAPDD